MNVLVTHADEPIGRRVVKTLYHDESVGRILATGAGAPPRAFEPFGVGSDPRVVYVRLDLARHRPVADLFRSARFRAMEIEAVVHVPQHGVPARAPARIAAGLPERTAEARILLQHCLETASVRRLVAVGSAFVYRLPPGNANRLDEDSPLDLDPGLPAPLRSWVDCDMIFHGEVGSDRLRVVLLRVPTVVAEGGYVFLHPGLEGPAGWRAVPLGFDPLCALLCDKDVARAVRAALRARRAGVYNVAAAEAIPLSTLARWTGRRTLALPGGWLSLWSGAARLTGAASALPDGPHRRYGFTLDTRRAERELGFRPGYRVGLAPAGDGRLRLETAAL